MKGLLLSFDIWTHVFDSIIILLCHCKYVNKYTQTNSGTQNLETSTSAWNLSKRVEISRFPVFRLYFWNFDTIYYIEILLISYSTPGIQQWHVSLKPHRVEYPIIHPRWNSRFGYTLYWVQTRPGCDVVLLVTATIEMYKCIYYLQLSAQCGGWRIQYRSPRTTMQLSDTALAVTTWPDNVHTAVWMGN